MCEGLAISVNGAGKVFCNGSSDHYLTKPKGQDDNCLDFECIGPNWITPIWDEGDDTCKKFWSKNGLLTKKGQPKKYLVDVVKKWLKDNEIQVLRWFLEQDKFQHQILETNQNMCRQIIEEAQFMNNQIVEKLQVMIEQTVKRSQYMNRQIVGGDQFLCGQTVIGNIYIYGMKQSDKEAQKILESFYKSDQEDHTIGTLIKWLKRRHKSESNE